MNRLVDTSALQVHVSIPRDDLQGWEMPMALYLCFKLCSRYPSYTAVLLAPADSSSQPCPNFFVTVDIYLLASTVSRYLETAQTGPLLYGVATASASCTNLYRSSESPLVQDSSRPGSSISDLHHLQMKFSEREYLWIESCQDHV